MIIPIVCSRRDMRLPCDRTRRRRDAVREFDRYVIAVVVQTKTAIESLLDKQTMNVLDFKLGDRSTFLVAVVQGQSRDNEDRKPCRRDERSESESIALPL